MRIGRICKYNMCVVDGFFMLIIVGTFFVAITMCFDVFKTLTFLDVMFKNLGNVIFVCILIV